MTTARPCRLQEALDRIESCPGEACGFWELGARGAAGACVFDRLGIDVSQDAGLASYLLDVRARLELMRAADQIDDGEWRLLLGPRGGG